MIYMEIQTTQTLLPRVGVKSLNQSEMILDGMSPRLSLLDLVNMTLKVVGSTCFFLFFLWSKCTSLDHWRWEFIPFSGYNGGKEKLGGINLIIYTLAKEYK